MSTINLSACFHGYHSAQQSKTQGQLFELDTLKQCHRESLAEVRAFRAYYYGEVQTDVAQVSNSYDIEIVTNTLALCQGFQSRNVGTVGIMDDGVYGVSEDSGGIKMANVFNNTAERSDANQTRLFGLRIAP